MSDLIEFLLARITEDEASAMHPQSPSAYAVHASRADREEALLASILGIRCPTCHVQIGEPCLAMLPPGQPAKPAGQPHGTRTRLGRAEFRRRFGTKEAWSPSRVLAECAAKATIVRNIAGPPPYRDDDHIDEPGLAILESLATVYADHPDYRDEWRP